MLPCCAHHPVPPLDLSGVFVLGCPNICPNIHEEWMELRPELFPECQRLGHMPRCAETRTSRAPWLTFPLHFRCCPSFLPEQCAGGGADSHRQARTGLNGSYDRTWFPSSIEDGSDSACQLICSYKSLELALFIAAGSSVCFENYFTLEFGIR